MSLIGHLRQRIAGGVITPQDAAYEQARRVFYGSYDRRPAVIVRPADASDIAEVIKLAADTGLELAVRSGGHSPAGHGTTEGGILLDLSSMAALDINAAETTAWAETGLSAGQYSIAAGALGLATPFGDTGSVGIGGLTLGGGIGYLVRKYGLTLDNLLAVDLVTADSSLIRVTDDTDPELFWALRGGGGNFGVATRFQLRLHPVDTIVGGMMILPATAQIITRLIAEAESAPDELSTIANVMLAPPEMPGLPDEYLGQPIVMLLMAYAGDTESGEKVVKPFRSLATPIVDLVKSMSYSEIFQFTAGGPPPKEEAAWSFFIDEVDDDHGEAIIDHLHQASAPIAVAQLRALGGAFARVPVEATAFAHRPRRVIAAVGTVFDDPGELDAQKDWVQRLTAALHRGEPGVYVGFMGEEDEERVHEAYPNGTWNRLAAVKANYDPTNLFRRNQNVPPG